MQIRTLFITVFVTVLALGATACGDGAAGAVAVPPDVAAPPADAQRSASGLAWRVLTPGTGTRHPRPNSEVTVHYTGWKTDGTEIDSSVRRGEPASFPLDRVIPGGDDDQFDAGKQGRRAVGHPDLADLRRPGWAAPGGIVPTWSMTRASRIHDGTRRVTRR